MNFLDEFRKNHNYQIKRIFFPLRKSLLNVVVQTERWTNKMKLTVAYHYFADSLKNILKI